MKPRRRSKGIPNSERFFQMHVWLISSEAWKATNVYERCLYMELKQRYNGTNNGEIPLSHREAQLALNCSNKPVMAAFAGLINKGFIRPGQVGSFHWKVGGGAGGRSTRWILTEYPVDLPLRSLIAEKTFMRWKPEKDKSRCAESIPKVCPEHAINHDIVCQEHTIKPKLYAEGIR